MQEEILEKTNLQGTGLNNFIKRNSAGLTGNIINFCFTSHIQLKTGKKHAFIEVDCRDQQ